MKDSFILYTAQYEALKELAIEQKGQLLDCLFQYAITGTMPATNSEAVRVAMNFLRIQIDMDSTKYEKRCEKNKAIALERERKKKEAQENTNVNERVRKNTKVNKRTQTNTNVTDNDNENDNENVNDNENDNENVETNVSYSSLHTQTDTHAHEAGEEKKEKNNNDPWQADNEETAFILIMQYFNKCVHLYHSDIKPVRALTEDRRQKLRVILSKYHSAALRAAVSNAMQSEFLNGRTKRRKAAADFDWIMEEKHFVQCIENSL